MKALTLTQPWATLVAIGAKRIETRSWGTSYRGPLAIHAAKAFPREAKNLVYANPFYRCLSHVKDWDRLTTEQIINALPRGVVLAKCVLVGCVPTDEVVENGVIRTEFQMTDQERAMGDYSADRWAWLLADIRPLNYPIPAKGALGLWEWTTVPAEVRAS